MNVGHQLRQIRKRLNITQEELAARAGCDQSTIAGIETGRRTGRLELLVRIARALNVSLDELVEGENGAGEKDLRAGRGQAG